VVEINDSKKAEIRNNIESNIPSTNVNENESYATQSAIINGKNQKRFDQDRERKKAERAMKTQKEKEAEREKDRQRKILERTSVCIGRCPH
jgi:hypothetical protein